MEAHVAEGNITTSKLVPESLEERLGFEAAVKNTTKSAALEFVVGNAVFVGNFVYMLATGIATGDASALLHPYVAGAVWGALSYDAWFRYVFSAGTPHQPAGLGQGITFILSYLAHTYSSKESRREMRN